MSYQEKRLPTFISLEENGDKIRRCRPHSASAKTSRSREEVPIEPRLSDTSLHIEVDEYIDTLIDRVIIQLSETKSPEPTSDATEEPVFRSPKETLSCEKNSDIFYSPRSEGDEEEPLQMELTSKQDKFITDEASGDSLEFTLKDIPLQEDAQSPLKPVLSAQLLAEINETLNSILNLDESIVSDDDDENLNELDDGDSSILIEYADTPLEQYIPNYVDYFKDETPTPEYVDIETEANEKPAVTDTIQEEFPMTTDIEETFNALLYMAEKDGDELNYTISGNGSTDTRTDMHLQVGLSDMDDDTGTELRRSLKTPDATKPEETIVKDAGFTSDEEEGCGFVVISHTDLNNEVLMKYEEFKETLNKTEITTIEDIKPETIEMHSKVEGSLSAEGASAFKPKKGNRALKFFDRAVSAFRLWRSRSWTLNQKEEKDKPPHIEVLVDTLEGPVHLIQTKRLPSAELDTGNSEEKGAVSIEMSGKDEMSELDRKVPTTGTGRRRFFSRAAGTRSLPRNAERLRAIFRKNY